jgi:hypothetical protein
LSHGGGGAGRGVLLSAQDLDLAMKGARQERDNNHEQEDEACFDMALDDVKDVLRKEADYRQRLGDCGFESMLRFSRRRAQEYLLGRAAITSVDLASMYDASGRDRSGGNVGADRCCDCVEDSPERASPGRWRLGTVAQEIDDKLCAFQARFGCVRRLLSSCFRDEKCA